MSKNSLKRPRTILLKPLHRYRYSASSFPNDGRERETQSSNDYRVFQSLVSSSHECEMFHLPFFLDTNHNDDNEKDSLKNVGILGEIEVTVEEYCGPLRNGYTNSLEFKTIRSTMFSKILALQVVEHENLLSQIKKQFLCILALPTLLRVFDI